ncbi:MAG: hypothetical protein FJ293_15105 [Planctomycetes bacterium]|nr:hypothetical protein [Planctomycetota bacterium]
MSARPENEVPPIPERAPRWLLISFVVVIAIAGCGFLFKLAEFAQTLEATPDVSFALMPMVTYLAVAAGFFCLLGWATLSGHWKDLEAPKRFHLENEAELDARTPPPGSPTP